MSLAGVQGQRPCWGLGQRPNCFVQPTQKENSSAAALVAGSEASLRSNFARPQTRPPAALSNNRAVSRQMGATAPYATRRNLLFIHQNRSFLIADYPGGVPCPPSIFPPLLLLPFVLLTAFLCLAVLLGGQDFVHALLNVAVLP